jgi:hypothetical protein
VAVAIWARLHNGIVVDAACAARRLAFRAALRNSDFSQVRVSHSSRPAREEAMRRNDERHG